MSSTLRKENYLKYYMWREDKCKQTISSLLFIIARSAPLFWQSVLLLSHVFLLTDVK